MVTDLGNNGLPFSGEYVQGTGVVEIPFPTVDIDWFQVKVGDGATIDASFNPTTYNVNEGASTSVTIDITTDPALPATHPAFDLTLSVAPGGAAATPGGDYTALAVTVPVPENATSVTVPIQTADDGMFEGTETITMTIAAPLTPPAGFQVSTDAPTAVVSILDDEVDPSTTTTGVDNSTTTTAVDNSTTTTAVDNSTTTTAVDNSTTTTAVDNSTTTTAVDNSTTTTAVDNSTTTTAVETRRRRRRLTTRRRRRRLITRRRRRRLTTRRRRRRLITRRRRRLITRRRRVPRWSSTRPAAPLSRLAGHRLVRSGRVLGLACRPRRSLVLAICLRPVRRSHDGS